MTRKRFIKLLMSHGYSRNKAVELANYFNSRNIPYKIAYSNISTLKPKLLTDVTRIIDAFNNTCRALSKAFENLSESFKRVSSSLIRMAGEKDA